MSNKPFLKVYTPEQTLNHRKTWLYHPGRAVMTHKVEARHGSITTLGQDHLHRAKGGIIAPTHESFDDIPIEADALWSAGYMGRWAMKSTLPPFYRFGGGIFFTRLKDLKQLPREERGEALKKAKGQGENGYEAIRRSLENGEFTVIHPGGERKAAYSSDRNVLGNISDIVGTEHAIIPLKIRYSRNGQEGVVATFKEPFRIPAGERSERIAYLDARLLSALN